MSKVIDINIARYRLRPLSNDLEWLFDLRVSSASEDSEGFEGTITEFNDTDGLLSDGDRLRSYAEALNVLAWLLRQQAEDLEPSEDSHCLATVQIFESSKARVRFNHERVSTEEHFKWLERRLDDAKLVLRPRK